MTENVTRLPGRAAPGNGGGGGSDLGERVARLESDVSNIAENIREIKSDLRRLWRAGLVAVVLLVTTFITVTASSYVLLSGRIDSSYVLLDGQIDTLDKRLDEVDKSLVRLQAQNRQILQRLDQLTEK